jgi:hypothetical protein
MSDDPFNLRQFTQQLAQAPNLREYFQHEADRTAHVPAVLDVPVRVVPPPVTVKGELKFLATFPHDEIFGVSYDQVIQKILDAFQNAGLPPNPFLPEIRIANVNAWREEIGRPDSDRTASGVGSDHNEQFRVEREYFEQQRQFRENDAISRGDTLAAASAANAVPGVHSDGSGGIEEHGADSPAGDVNDPAERG